MSEAEYHLKVEAQLQAEKARQEREYFKRLWEAEVEVNDGRRGKELEILFAGFLVGLVVCVVGWLIWRGV